MTTRTLPHEEWGRLATTEAGDVWAHLDPTRTHVIVVEEGGDIIACQVLMQVLHAECLWVHPEHRRPSVSRALWSAVQSKAKALGARSLATAATTERVKRLLAYVHATKLEGEHYVIPMEGPCQPQ